MLYTIVTSCRVVRNEPLNDHVTRAAAEYIVNDTRDVTVIILPGKSGRGGREGREGREGGRGRENLSLIFIEIIIIGCE